MSFKSRDNRYGPHFYAPVGYWEENGGDITDAFTNESTRIGELFGEIYFPFTTIQEVQVEDPETHDTTTEYKEVLEYLDCGLALDDIIETYLQLFDEKLVAFPYYPLGTVGDSTSGIHKSVGKIFGAITSVLNLNYWKYAKLVQTLGLVYDPIENYNMIEGGTDDKTYSGSTTKQHQVNATQIGSIKLSGKATGITIKKPGDPIDPQDTSKGNYTQFTITEMDVDENGRRKTMTDATSDTRSGAYASRTTPAADEEPTDPAISLENAQDTDSQSDGTPSVGQGTPVRTSNYITTMDSAAESRLHDYSLGQGTTAQGFYSDVVDDIPVMAEITAGNPAFASYTDTETHGIDNIPRKDTLDHSLTRSGNIGVTTSQQMIEQERQLVKFSVLREFFDDVNKELLLSVWY